VSQQKKWGRSEEKPETVELARLIAERNGFFAPCWQLQYEKGIWIEVESMDSGHMRTIDVFVSAASDVQNESAITEQLIRSVAAEFDLPVQASYSNPLRGSKEDAAVEREDPEDESVAVVRACFWDGPALPRADLPERDQTQYDLVICLLWSRLASVPVEKCVLPNGSRPWSATDYDADSVLAQSRATSADQRLRVYRNRATPNSLLEPKEARAEMCRQWDAVQEFLARWEKDNALQFRDCCHEFLDLEEFANLFRRHFRNFIVEQLDRRVEPKKAPAQSRFRTLNPFRGLNFFDLEHAAFYCGRTRAIGEVLDALKRQAAAKKPLVLVLGPSGSGKTSLLRAGVLPLLTRGGTTVGGGPWNHVITRPGVADPIDTLAAALLAEPPLSELRDATKSDESPRLASRLKKDPENAASQIAAALGKTKIRLALVVDQLEELFVGIPPVLQRKYVTALCALARSAGIYVIAALRSEFYAQYQRFPELVELTSGGGKYELQPPTACELANMIRLPAEAAGLRFERDSETDRSVDNFLLKAATSSSDALPLLEHLLSLLYNRQLRRKDGLLRWSDYCELGQFKNALAQHAEFVFLTLRRDEQHAFKLIIRQLVAPVTGKERVLIRRPVPYHELVSSPKFNNRQSAAARDLVDCLVNEGLLSAEIDAKHSRLIRIPQDALLNHWPRLLNSLSEDQHFFGMRDRLDESITLWVSRGSQNDHLLYDRVAVAEAETLLKDFPSALSETQITYIKKSLARQKRHGWVRRNYLGLAAMIAFALFAVIMSAERFNSTVPRTRTKKDVEPAQPDKDLATKDTTALEAQLKDAEGQAELAQQNVELANRERAALETQLKAAEDALRQLQDTELTGSDEKALKTQLKESEEKLKEARANSEQTSSQLTSLQVQLRQEQDKDQKVQANVDSLTSERKSLQSQLKQAEAKALLAQQNADLFSSQRSALESQLKEEVDKLKQVQTNSGDLTGQLSALQAQLKQEQEKEQKAQANTDSLTSERNALQGQVKQAEAKALLAQQNADLVSSQHSALETQLKEAEAKLSQAQANSGDAAGQLGALQAQLKQEQEKEQKSQANADSLTSERKSLQSQLKQAEAKALLAQQNADLISSQHSALETELKEAEAKLNQAQANSGDAAGQLGALQAQLKQEQQKEQGAQANADSLSSERDSLQNQLKATEEKLEQVQANSGSAAGQLDALQTQLKQEQEKEQKAQANADSLSGERSALQSQLKDTEGKLKHAQATSADTANQLSVLQAQLKQEQEKSQKAQANLDSLTTERNVLQSQLKQAEAKALVAQRNADLLSSQRDALEAQLRETGETLNRVKPSSGDSADKLRALQARLYSAQPAAPTPSPSNSASGTENAPEFQSNRDREAVGNVEPSGGPKSLKEFVLGYLRTVASNDTSVQRRYFADRVNFYGRGVLDSSNVAASTEEYHREWPIREWTPRGEARIARLRHSDRFVVHQPFRWSVSDGSRHAQGDSTLYLLIHRDSQGELRIVNVHQLDR
jgi:peptidoglycan hydrolase CwlO-like protein